MNHFHQTIQHLRHYEEMLIYAFQPDIPSAEIIQVSSYLRNEYAVESLNFPHDPPEFDEVAAVWAAKTIYLTAQLIVYRQLNEQEMIKQLPEFTAKLTPGAILSADLCLRFLPELSTILHKLDPDDSIIPILHRILHRFPYSAIGTYVAQDEQELLPIVNDSCTLQLYTDRVIAKNDLNKALHPLIKPSVHAALGNHAAHFWNTFYIESNFTYATH